MRIKAHHPEDLEQLRQRCPLGMRDAEIGAVAQHTGLCRIAAGEKRDARRIAERKLAVIPIEAHTRLGERIKIRRPGAKHTGVTTQLHAHIVRHDEQHVRLAGGFGSFPM